MNTFRNLCLAVAITCGIGACTAEEDPQVITLDVSAPQVDASVDSGASPDSAPVDVDMSTTALAPPANLERWMTGDDADAEVAVGGPGLILMGGGAEPDDAFHWWVPLLGGGDVVVLRVSGSDGYNDYLFSDIGGVDSVETLKVSSRVLADDPYVAWRIDHAEGVFLAGGDQWDYLSLWSGTGLHSALRRVHDRGAVLGGTSAGLAVLGDRAFSAENDTVTSGEALDDPFNEFMRFEDDFLTLAPLAQTVTDSHFHERDRMGRLVAFVGRMWTDGFTDPVGIGVDEGTALLIGPQGRTVVGVGAVYEVTSAAAPAVCSAGETLEWSDIAVERTTATDSQSYTIGASGGALAPDPY